MLEILKTTVCRFRQGIRIYQLVLRDARVSRLSKWLLGLAIVYALSPIDLISDFIPILGQLDDLLVVPVLLFLALLFLNQD